MVTRYLCYDNDNLVLLLLLLLSMLRLLGFLFPSSEEMGRPYFFGLGLVSGFILRAQAFSGLKNVLFNKLGLIRAWALDLALLQK
jgi:hypothetical protein